MLKSILIFYVGWFFAGCDKDQPDFFSSQPTESSNKLRYLALGDSYTIGEGVTQTERFPYLAVTQLKQSQIEITDPEYIATTGWTTSNLLKAIQDRQPKGPYDIVTLLIGVNDQYQRMDTAGYRIRFRELLYKSIVLAGNRASRVFILSIPDYSATPFVSNNDKERVRKEIDAFNEINRMETLQSKVSYIDITTSSRLAATDPSLLASDRLHYSAKEHKNWVDLLIPLIKSSL